MRSSPRTFAWIWWEMPGLLGILWRIKDRAEGKLVAPAPALSEALMSPGVQHLMNHTIPISHVKFAPRVCA